LFVLNAGDATGAGNVSGFKVLGNGTLKPIAGAVQPLSEANTAPAQIQFATDGRHLLVTEKATNRILSYRVRTNGVPDPAVINASAGQTPFGFALGNRAQLFVSDAAGGAPNASSLSSYRLRWDGQLQLLSPAVGTTQTAACWVALTPDERFAFTTNTGSGTISSYRIALGGTVKLAEAAAADTGAGSGPIDMAMSPDGRLLYTLDAGTDSIVSYRVNQSGKLTAKSVRDGIPDGANGLAIR
jgi:6-phosphogluconolactonase (cycloisomerase 2 family)